MFKWHYLSFKPLRIVSPKKITMKYTIRNISTLLFFSLNLHFIYAQTTVSGKIANTQQKAMADVSIMLMRADTTVIDFTMSNDKGLYKIEYNGKESNLIVSASAFGTKPMFKKIENRSQEVDFVLEQKDFELREVTVKSSKIWGQKDTINYLVSAFSDDKDVVIGDVLKKMPGINVAEGGQISYQGKPINKFYIENLNLLGGRYGIATNNINAKDISTVQVLENHQPIKALENVNISDQAAINLKLKDDKKGIFKIMATLGLGSDSDDLLWSEQLTSTYFAKKHQNMSTYKTNNNGVDISKELISYIGNNPISGLQMTTIQQPPAPSIRFNRYNFNNSHAVTTNNLNVLKNDAKLKTNVLFYRNEDKRHGFSRTSYLIPGKEEQIVEEDISARATVNNLDGEIDYELNKDRIFLNNNLRISGSWDDQTGNVITAKHIHQQLDNKSFSVTNNTKWVKRSENDKGLEVESRNAFRTQPHHLKISTGLYPDLFNDGKEYSSLTQHVCSNVFISNNRFSLLSAMNIGRVRINPTANLSLEHRNLDSSFDVIDKQFVSHPVTDIDMNNDIQFTRVNVGFSLGLSYIIEKIKLDVNLPTMYRYTDLDNKLIRKNSINQGKLYFQPSIFMKYDPSMRVELTAKGGYNSSIPNLNSLYTGYILQNYRNINRYNDTNLFDTKNISGSLGASYKDVMNLFFASGDISLSHYKRDGIYGQTIDGILTMTEFLALPNTGNSVSVVGRSSKGFNWKEILISIEASWGQSENEQLRQTKFVKYKSQWLNANFKLYLRPVSWLTAEYKGAWGRSKAKVNTGERFKSIQSLTQEMSAYVCLPFGLNVNASGEHYYNNVPQTNKNFSLLDLGLGYSKKEISYSLNWTNILNTSKYVSASYGALNTYYSECDIRSAAVMLNVRFKLH